MANPEFRAVSGPVSVPANGNGSVSLPLPAGVVDGDYIIVVCGSRPSSGVGNAAPAGFTLLHSVNNNIYGGGYRVYGKVAASEPADYTLTETANTAVGMAFAVAYSSPGSPPVNVSAQAAGVSSAAPPLPAVTNTAAGKLVGVVIEYQGRTLTLTPAGALTARRNGTTADIAHLLADEDVAGTGTSLTGRGVTSSATGDFFAVSVFLSGESGPVITAEPTDQTAAAGGTATFSVTATGATSYQWQRIDPFGGAWANIGGATSSSYTTGTLARGADSGAVFRCRVSDGTITVDSAAALLRVTALPTSYAAAVGLVVGSSASFIGESQLGASDANVSNTLTPTPGTFTLQGFDAGLLWPRRIACDAGSFTLGGQDANLLYQPARTLAAAPGSFIITGEEMLVDRSIAADTGSFAVTGNDATLSRVSARTLGADAGSFAVTGQDAGLLRGRRLGCDSGSFALGGVDAGLLQSHRLAADAGSFTLGGLDTALRAARRLVCEAGSFAVSGNDAALIKTSARTLLAEAGSFTVAGQDTALIGARRLVADASSFAVTGNDATLTRTAGRTLAADAGSFAVTGSDAALRFARRLLCEPGPFVVTGQPAELLQGHVLPAAAGSFTVTGRDAGLSRTRVLLAEGGGYLVAGVEAGLVYSNALSVAPPGAGHPPRITLGARPGQAPSSRPATGNAARPRTGSTRRF
jgi:hypothetical protein